MRIVILGSSEMLSAVIDGVLQTNSEIVGIVNWRDIKKKRLFGFFKTDYVRKKIKKLKLPVLKVKTVNSEKFKSLLLSLEPDILLVGTWGEKIQKYIFDIPKIASINIHPSLLPKYRGANPYSRVIMFGEKKTGVTFHLLDENFDSGAILLQREIGVLETDNAETLKLRICGEIPELTKELINKLDNKIILPIVQNSEDATYFYHVKPSEIVVEPEKMTFEEIHNKIRGLAPWQSSYLLYKGSYFKILDYVLANTYIRRKNTSLCLKTKDDKYIYFKKLQAFGWVKKYFTSIILNYLHR